MKAMRLAKSRRSHLIFRMNISALERLKF